MNNFDITDIESVFTALVKTSGATATVYNDRPKATTQADDFAVVHVSGKVMDRDTYGECEVGIHLFVRDIMTQKNNKKLGLMYDAVMGAIPSLDGRYLIDQNPYILPDVSDDYGFHARIITFSVTILKEQ